MNVYLTKLQERYAALQTSAEGIQSRAAQEDRSLTEVELATIKGQAEQMRGMAGEIEVLAAEETRHQKVAGMTAGLTPVDPQHRSYTMPNVGVGTSLTAVSRDPGHYRAASEGGTFSFFGDMGRAVILQDAGAQGRLAEHNAFMRAQTTSSIAGVVPPKWLADLYTVNAQQGRALANAVANYEITDARPFSLPGQTANTVVVTQPTGENGALVDGDSYDAAAVTITPSTLVGQETVSRQLLDASTPAIDQLILSDLTASYNAKLEALIGAAIKAVGTAIGGTVGDFADLANGRSGYDLAVDSANAVRKSRFLRPNIFAMDYDTYAAYLKLKDESGRPVVVASAAGPQNAIGVNGPQDDGWIAGVPVVVSSGMAGTATNLYAAMLVGQDVIVFESPQMSFRYEEVAGPESIKLGLWRYTAVAVRQGTKSVKNIHVSPGAESSP